MCRSTHFFCIAESTYLGPIYTFALVTVATIMLAVVFPSILHSLTTVKLRFQFPIFIDSRVFPGLWGIILDLGAGDLFRAVHGSGRAIFSLSSTNRQTRIFWNHLSLDFAAKQAWSFQISLSIRRAQRRGKSWHYYVR